MVEKYVFIGKFDKKSPSHLERRAFSNAECGMAEPKSTGWSRVSGNGRARRFVHENASVGFCSVNESATGFFDMAKWRVFVGKS